jgi:hypothetical protein
LLHAANFGVFQGSAAAVRGFSSSTTADAVAKFLVEISCEGSGRLPHAPESPAKFDLDSITFKTGGACTSVKAVSASSFGTILMQEGIRPLMKQRLTHASLKYINMAYEKEREEAMSGKSVSASQIGVLMVVSYVVCVSDLSNFDRSTIHKIATLVVEGFSSEIFELPAQLCTSLQADITKTRTLIVCALLKLLCLVPASVNGLVMTMVSGLLRSYAVCDPETEVGCKVLALQGLEQIAHLEGAKASILAVKPAVVAILASAMNQKSGLLRSAAVDVRNAWYLVE